MKRNAFNFISALSLALCFASVFLWLRSYHPSPFPCYRARTASGALAVGIEHGALFALWESDQAWDRHRGPDRTSILGIVHAVTRDHFDTFGPDGRVVSRYVGLPCWMPTAVFALLPALLAKRWWTIATRRARGLCPTCGYNLRATPDSVPSAEQCP